MQGDIQFAENVGESLSQKRLVASGAVSTINAGEPTKDAGAGVVAIMVDGNGTTSERFSGIAKIQSTDTVAAAGEVYVFLPLPGLIYKGKAKSATGANTQAKIDALKGVRVPFDLTAGVWTVDAAASDASTNGLCITGGEYQTNTLYFAMRSAATIF